MGNILFSWPSARSRKIPRYTSVRSIPRNAGGSWVPPLKAAFAPPDRILFMRDSTLMAQSFDVQRLELHGDAFPVVESVGINLRNKGPQTIGSSHLAL
jgi:hypothetical protein